MRYRNDTSISDEKLMRIIQFADPDGLLEHVGEIIISNEADANGAGLGDRKQRTHEEAEEFKEEVAWLGRERVASDLRL